MDENGGLVGRIATSKAGRDKNRSFVIVDMIDADHAAVADGKLRKLSKPKKKKLKHLVLEKDSAELIRQKLTEGKQVLDSEIRGSLTELGYNRDRQE